MDDMDEPMPAPTENPRSGLRRKSTAQAADRLSAIIAQEKGAARAVEGKATLDERMASLAAALRRARVENADHSAALADLRAAEIARLEILADALAPVLAQVPADCDIFDVAVSPSERPRLFIDQIGFVEMDRDRRTYRFLQDTRHGRVTLIESEKIDALVDAVTNYIAHRLIERERALAIDYASGGAARALRVDSAAQSAGEVGALRGKAFQAFLFVVEFLGSAAFFGMLAVIALWAYRTYIAH